MSTVDTDATNNVASTPAAPSQVGDQQVSAPASEDTSATGQDEGTQPDKQSRRESRAFASMRRENRELQRTLGRMEARIEALSQPAPQQTEGAPPPQQRPTYSPDQIAAVEADAEAAQTVLDRLEEAGEDIEGFDDVMKTITKPSFPITPVMRDFLGDTDRPAEMAKWLADNPGEARRISQLSPPVALRALERAEAKIAKPAASNRTTRAPAPPQTVTGGAAAPQAIERMSYDDLRAQVAKWGRN